MTIQDKFSTIPDKAQVSVLWSKGAAEFICDAGQIKRMFRTLSSFQEVDIRDVGSDVEATGAESPSRFKVGDRLRNRFWGEDGLGGMIVTRVTRTGFEYQYSSVNGGTKIGRSCVDDDWLLET